MVEGLTLNQELAARGLAHRPIGGTCQHEYFRLATGEVVFVGTVSRCWEWLATATKAVAS